MAWAVTSNPDDYDEALAWFRGRVPMLKKDWLALDEQARRRAFTIAGVGRVSVVQDVLTALEDAVKNGETLEDFKAKVGAKLAAEWGGPNARRVDLIFRNGVQHAYNAGRYTLATFPEVLRARPFWMFDAVLDNRTTPVCRGSDGTILPADHDFWKTHYPPLHHACRSSVRTLTAAEAGERGVSENPPELEAGEGFGATPSLAEPLKLAPLKVKDLAKAIEAAFNPPPLTGAQVRDRLSQLDSDTSKQLEALEKSRAEAYEHFKTFRSGGENSYFNPDGTVRKDRFGSSENWEAERVKARDKWLGLGEKVKALREQRAADAFDILKADKPLTLRTTMHSNTKAKLSAKTEAHWQEGIDKFCQLVGEHPGLTLANGDTHLVTFERLPPTGRAFYRESERRVYVTEAEGHSVIVHELGHWFEYRASGALDASKAFYARRTDGEELQKLKKLFPKSGYDASEVTKTDKFIDPYAGKWYTNSAGEQRATELITMGLQYMIEDPFKFAQLDPDHFDFIWHLIRGIPYH